ncbi:uncharacterized protein AMSG_10107 [Thecamonas trahens ATCC 50062]|uniref:Uncharacterized protein n=1 Tax=Thecamonas trahens ATCC 50062 TaxID=461836 RepID=A0A0L0DQ09_THETB|nr:hypothetical protein AMSG_10107 [Thecamonas trahens ATCC 50062]KNC54387.1 hypothetical protein AMSG_10107 [Thecamonas trahens ATCC 50062]|eukprot:XP_013753686.1 hypothetical protein AMSG_10107 [Thecamonas trahens ATCC 50062]
MGGMMVFSRSITTLKRLRNAGKKGDVAGAVALFEALQADGQTPPTKAWEAMMAAHLANFDLDKAKEYADGLLAAFPANELSGKSLEPLMKSMGEAGRLGEMQALVDRLQQANISPLPISPLVQAHVKSANVDAAAEVLDGLVASAGEVNQAWIRTVLDGYFGVGSGDGVRRMAQMVEAVGGEPEPAMQSLLQRHAKSANPAMRDQAKQLLDKWFPGTAVEDGPVGGGGSNGMPGM